jgi:hypothetical protein
VTGLWLALALAAEPGAARGELQPDCACMEVQPGAHADKHATTWLPFPAASHLEHLELANKPLLSAVFADRRRVSLADRDAVVSVAADVLAVTPLPLRDQGTGFDCKHLSLPPVEPRELEIVLVDTAEARVDAAAVGRALRQGEMALRSCLGSGSEERVELTVKPSGKLSVGDSSDCVADALKGRRASLSLKAGGAQTWLLRTP